MEANNICPVICFILALHVSIGVAEQSGRQGKYQLCETIYYKVIISKHRKDLVVTFASIFRNVKLLRSTKCWESQIYKL